MKQLAQLRHLLGALGLVLPCLVSAQTTYNQAENEFLLRMLNPLAKVATRAPSNYIPRDDLESVPFEQDLWIDRVMKEDNRGVLIQLKRQLQDWQKMENHVENWDLESTGVYDLPTYDEKRRYVEKYLLRYLDKRLSGEIKDAQEGSTLYKVGQVHKALRPAAKAEINEYIKLRFKARVLQGKAFILIDNPWVEHSTSVSADGDVEVKMSKRFNELKLFANLEYQVHDEQWMAYVDRPITNKITARISSIQKDDELAFSGRADKTLQFFFHHAF